MVSTEDMLSRVHEANRKNLARRQEWAARRLKKIMTDCDSCGDSLSIMADCTKCETEHRETDEDGMMEFWDSCGECETCGPRVTARMETDCNRCGKRVSKKELERVLLGNDVVGLFPKKS